MYYPGHVRYNCTKYNDNNTIYSNPSLAIQLTYYCLLIDYGLQFNFWLYFIFYNLQFSFLLQFIVYSFPIICLLETIFYSLFILFYFNCILFIILKDVMYLTMLYKSCTRLCNKNLSFFFFFFCQTSMIQCFHRNFNDFYICILKIFSIFIDPYNKNPIFTKIKLLRGFYAFIDYVGHFSAKSKVLTTIFIFKKFV